MQSVLTSLILDVQDLDRSLQFYRDLLCLPIRRQESFDGHRLAYLRTGTAEILLMQQPLADQSPLLDRTGGMVIKFKVPNLNAIVHVLSEFGLSVLRDVEQAAWGERTCLVADPDGYAVLLCESVEAVN